MRPAARNINEAIDRALLEPGETHRRALAQLGATLATEGLAERLRRRGTLLARRDRRRGAQILRSRDRLMLALYANATPRGWHTAWCDGSTIPGGPATGVGGLLMDPSGRIVVEVARRVAALAPFEAEIAALVAILETARTAGVRRLRVYSDCVAAAQLWHRHRDDPRLASLAAWARQFRRLEITALPRTHNQPAHRLARAGAAGA